MIFFCAAFATAAAAADNAPGENELAALVDQAGRPEVFYSRPGRRDSLIAVLAGKAEHQPAGLVGMLDTPWALHFEVVRRALEKMGEPAAQALRAQLSGSGERLPLALLLAAFENLGTPGDEKILSAALVGQDAKLRVLAARCLAVFGSDERAINMLVPWLGHSSARVRLAAVWALGRVCERSRKQETARSLIEKVRLLCRDPHPLVRYTASETLGIINPQAENIPEPLTPVRQ